VTTSDTELIEEVRQLTGYTSTNDFTDSDIQSLVNTAKDEIRSYLNSPTLSFYQRAQPNTFQADRALFWFTCIALKVRAGEIGNVELTIDGLEVNPTERAYSFWFQRFQQAIQNAHKGIAQINATRSAAIRRDGERTYGNKDFG